MARFRGLVGSRVGEIRLGLEEIKDKRSLPSNIGKVEDILLFRFLINYFYRVLYTDRKNSNTTRRSLVTMIIIKGRK